MNNHVENITTKILIWESVDDALEYFISQNRIEVLNKFEIQSLRLLSEKINFEFDEMAQKLTNLFNARRK